MPVFEAPAVYVWSSTITMCTYFMDHLWLKQFLDFRLSDANVSPLTITPSQYFIRADRNNRQIKVNVFNGEGRKLYTIERKTPLNPVWTMLSFPARREVATIRAGFFLRSIDFHNQSGLQHRGIVNENGLNGRNRAFYLNDGAKYVWTRGSKHLERVINPSGGDEEIRERIAKVRLMRQFKFDFEMLVDESKVKQEVALATGFISMMTQWGVGDVTETSGPTFIPSLVEGDLDQHKAKDSVVTVVFDQDNSEVEIDVSN